MLGVAHTFAFRCQLGLRSSEDSNHLDTQWLVLMAVEASCQQGAHLELLAGALAPELSSMVISEPVDFLPVVASFTRVSIPKGQVEN